MSDPLNYHREYSPYGLYSLFQFEGSNVISVLKNLNRVDLTLGSFLLRPHDDLLISKIFLLECYLFCVFGRAGGRRVKDTFVISLRPSVYLR